VPSPNQSFSNKAVLGIDIATHTGLAFLMGDSHRMKSIHPNSKGFSRVQSIATGVERFLDTWEPDVVVIEANTAGVHGNIASFIATVECATAIKIILFQKQYSWIEVSPLTLKKWTTGNGKADKKEMHDFVQSRWGFSSENTDLVDAYALARLGQQETEQLEKIKGVTFFKSGSFFKSISLSQ
jgi:Holliday junction resolvasome RuvABC endonuclease subunit